MKHSIGETRIAPPLYKAADMLESTGRRNEAGHPVEKVVVVITDGDPNDPIETEAQIKSLRSRGFRLLFVQVNSSGVDGGPAPIFLRSLALEALTPLPRAGSSAWMS